MPEKQLGKEAELGDGKVGRQGSLFSFFTDNTNAHIRSLDHTNIVASVTDTADPLFRELANEAGNVGLLRG